MKDILDTRFEGQEVDMSSNFAHLGDDINIIQKDPVLRRLHIGVGWDVNSFNAEDMDLDLSAFLIGKTGMTRQDSDFVFYNNPQACDGGVQHGFDSRSGAGDGDDEFFFVDLHSVPFEIMQIVLVVSIYSGIERQQNMGMVRNAYIRIVNAETGVELLRYKIDKNLESRAESAMTIGHLNREGPKWHFVPKADFHAGGLAEIATRYGLIIVNN